MFVGEGAGTTETRLTGFRTHAAVLGLFVILTLVMLYPYPLRAATHLRDLGDPLEYAWVLGYSAHRLLTAPLQLYDGNIFYPFKGSLAYSDSTIASTITALPVLLATGNPVLASNLLILLSFVLAGFGVYLLVADLTGSKLAGIVGGAIFAFNPYRIDHLSQIPNMASHWIPFVFFALHRFLSGRSRWWAAGFGIFLTLQLLSSFYYAYAVSLAVAVYLLCLFLWQPRRLLQARVGLPLLAAAAAAALLVVASLPYLEVSQRYGMQRTLHENEYFSARPQNYLAVPEFNRTWGQVERLVRWGAGERRLFPGLLAAALALVGLLKGRPRHQCVLFAVIGLFAFVLSLGPSLFVGAQGPPMNLPFPMPYRLLFDYLPGFQSMRVPARFAIVVMLAISVLAGCGTAYLFRLLARAGRSGAGVAHLLGIRAGLGGLLTVVVLAEYASFPIPMQPIATGSGIPEVYKWLREQPDKQVLVELPIDVNAFRQAPYMYFSTYHRWTLVNGWRSFVPPDYRELASVLQTFPSVESVATLADLKVRYVILHADQLPEADLLSRDLRFQRYGREVKLVQRFGNDYVYEVTTPPMPAALKLSIVSPCLAQTGRPYPASLVFARSGWRLVVLPDVPQWLRASAEWLSQDGKRFSQEVLIQAPNPVFQSAQAAKLPLVAPPDAGTYRLTVNIAPPLTLGSTSPGERVVVVQDEALPETTQSGAPTIQAAGFELPRKAVRAGDPVPLRVTWRTRSPSQFRGKVFFNVYDARHRYWAIDSRPVFGESAAEQTWCDGDEMLDVQAARLHPDTPPGYYWVEFGVMDPLTGRRQPILDPEGNVVDKVTAGRLRVARSEVYSADDVAPRHPADVNLGDQVQFLGWTGIPEQPRPAEPLKLTLYWHALRPPAADYTVFVHLYDGGGRLVAQHDGTPGGGAWPTSFWQVGDVIEDEFELHVPAGLPTGEYALAAGMYDLTTMRRLPLVEGPSIGDDRVLLMRWRVAP